MYAYCVANSWQLIKKMPILDKRWYTFRLSAPDFLDFGCLSSSAPPLNATVLIALKDTQRERMTGSAHMLFCKLKYKHRKIIFCVITVHLLYDEWRKTQFCSQTTAPPNDDQIKRRQERLHFFKIFRKNRFLCRAVRFLLEKCCGATYIQSSSIHHSQSSGVARVC